MRVYVCVAAFYEDLYKSRSCSTNVWSTVDSSQSLLDRISPSEVQRQIDALKGGKAADSSGIVSEMLKGAGDNLAMVIATLFNDIIFHGMSPPDE